MSALPLSTQHSALSTGVPSGSWLTLQEASRRSGMSEGHLRRQCLKWAQQGLAEKRKRSDATDRRSGPGPVMEWHIHETADPLLSRVKSPDQLPFDSSSLSDQQRKTVYLRKRLLDDWHAARAGGLKMGFAEQKVTQQFVIQQIATQGIKLSRSQLFAWEKSYRLLGLAGLVDERRNKKASEIVAQSDTLLENVKRFWLTQNRRSVSRCYELAIEAEQLAGNAGPFPSLRTVRRMLDQLPRQLVIKMREGNAAANDVCSAFIKRNYADMASNDLWCADHHVFDVKVLVGNDKDGKPKFDRPHLTAFQDLRSRKIVGWWISWSGNTDTIIRAFKVGAISHHLPRRIMFDNGKDFDARALQGRTKKQRRAGVPEDRLTSSFGLLDIAVQHTQPYHGQSKPIERFFGTVCSGFSKDWDTYCGGTPETRPENHVEQLEAGKAPTLEEFVAAFADWLDVYHHDGHSGDGMEGKTPDIVWRECLSGPRPISANDLHYAMLQRFGPVKVGRNGVRYRGLDFGATDARVAMLFGKSVILGIDQDDISKVMLIDEAGRPICVARQNTTLGFTATTDDVRAAIKESKQLNKTFRQYQEARPRLASAGDIHLLTMSAAARRQRAQQKVLPVQSTPLKLTTEPSPLTTHQLPVDASLPPLQKAIESQMKPPAPAPSAFTYRRRAEDGDDTDQPPAFSQHSALTEGKPFGVSTQHFDESEEP